MAVYVGPDGIKLPEMTTLERDSISVLEIGQFIYNSTTNQFQIYIGSNWVRVSF